MQKKLKIGVIGAGILGMCNALFLQKNGYNVTLFDRDLEIFQHHLMATQVIFLHMHH